MNLAEVRLLCKQLQRAPDGSNHCQNVGVLCWIFSSVFNRVGEVMAHMQEMYASATGCGLCLVLAGSSLAELPVGVLREVCRLLAHADIEQARLASKAMRSAVGKAAVTDM